MGQQALLSARVLEGEAGVLVGEGSHALAARRTVGIAAHSVPGVGSAMRVRG